MPKLKHPFNSGELITTVRDQCWSGRRSTVKNINIQLLDKPSEYEFVFPINIWRVEKIKNGRYQCRHPIVPVEEIENVEHDKDCCLHFDENRFQHLLKKWPIKAKIGDKIINPYLTMNDKYIIDNSEYILDMDVSVCTPAFGDDTERLRDARSFPFVTINKIVTKVFYNIKYDKFLDYIEHTYIGDYISIDRDICCTFNMNNENLEFYHTFNEIWSGICSSLSQET